MFSAASFSVPSAHAYLPDAKMPACLDGPDAMKIDNERVLRFKTTTRNQYLDRGFVKGRVTEAPNVQRGHDHFTISIGPGPKDTLEIIYNREFGAMPNIRVGDEAVVCGDYITSIAQSGHYPPSPEGAIVHWVHFNPGSREGSARHAHGFIMVGANLIGFDEAPAGDWDGRIIRTSEPNGAGNDPENPARRDVPRQQDQGAAESPRPKVKAKDRRRENRKNSRHMKVCSSLRECSEQNGR